MATITDSIFAKLNSEELLLINDLYLEMKKYKNIIDELEKYLFSQLQEYGGGGMVQEYYDKLKELKEGDKND